LKLCYQFTQANKVDKTNEDRAWCKAHILWKYGTRLSYWTWWTCVESASGWSHQLSEYLIFICIDIYLLYLMHSSGWFVLYKDLVVGLWQKFLWDFWGGCIQFYQILIWFYSVGRYLAIWLQSFCNLS
jgi:hypothetical protein